MTQATILPPGRGAASTPPGETVPPSARVLVQAFKAANVSIVAGLPDSLLKSAHRVLREDADISYVAVTNEAEMPGIVAGAYLGGRRAVMLMENSGLRQACEPLARFAFCHQVPMVMIMSFRGDLGENQWWGHNHAQTMEPLLRALRIPHQCIRRLEELPPSVGRAWVHADSSQWPVALVLSDECVEDSPRCSGSTYSAPSPAW